MNDSVAFGVNIGFATLLLLSSQYSLSPKQVIMGASVNEIKKTWILSSYMRLLLFVLLLIVCLVVQQYISCSVLYCLNYWIGSLVYGIGLTWIVLNYAIGLCQAGLCVELSCVVGLGCVTGCG